VIQENCGQSSQDESAIDDIINVNIANIDMENSIDNFTKSKYSEWQESEFKIKPSLQTMRKPPSLKRRYPHNARYKTIDSVVFQQKSGPDRLSAEFVNKSISKATSSLLN
jgi:hypothetical protein